MTTVRIQVPPVVATPRGAILAANTAVWLTHKLGAALHGFGHASAAAVTPDRAVSPYRRASPMLLEAIGRSLWAALESFGQRRAARELHALADRRQLTDPELSRLLRAAASYDATSAGAAR